MIHPDDRKFQCILWGEALNEPVKIFELNTVTYGMSCSPYLAIHVIRQLAEDEKMKFPLAASVFSRKIYVDDLFFCDLLKGLDQTEPGLAMAIPFDDFSGFRALGVLWCPSEDVFRFRISKFSNETCTKRSLLSAIAKLCDPMGWLAPVVILAKILLQKLWLQKRECDQHAPP